MMPVPVLPATSWVRIHDAGQADYVPDVFFCNRGSRVLRNDKDGKGEGPPRLVVWDMRTQAAEELVNQLGTNPEDAPQLIIHSSPSELPMDLVKAATTIQSPFNDTAFLQAVENRLQSAT